MDKYIVQYINYPDKVVVPHYHGEVEGTHVLSSTVVTGEAYNVLSTLPCEFVRTVITSPPYWSLRDYGIPGQIGLEQDPTAYIESLVRVFDQVLRVLAGDGSLWLNIGDSYTSGGRTWRAPDKKNPIRAMSVRPPTSSGLKPKELVGIPWRLAFALQEAGWYLRSDTIWRKPNAQPESVKDRPTRSHEYLFLLTKSERYYYNNNAVRECNGRNLRSVWDINTQAFRGAHFATFPPQLVEQCLLLSSEPGDVVLDPFLGSGTVAEVSIRHQRPFLGIELNPDYVSIARHRILQLPGLKGELKRLTRLKFKPIPANMAIDLYMGLINARRLKLQPALNVAVKTIGVVVIDYDLQRLVPPGALNHVASLGLRGERIFPVPAIIEHSPPLIGYYRMLLGLSQKEFEQSQRLGYGPWVRAEQVGRLPINLVSQLDRFCGALIKPLVELVQAMDQFDERDLNDLSLLTLGPTLQGGRNNTIGSKAAGSVFEALRSLVEPMITFDRPRLVRFQTKKRRVFELVAGSDPDIAINEGTGTDAYPLLALEVKGGKDLSNAHNRAGEAEKSHIKAKLQGYKERWTVIHMAGLDAQKLRAETPSSTELFEAANILSRAGSVWTDFNERSTA